MWLTKTKCAYSSVCLFAFKVVSLLTMGGVGHYLLHEKGQGRRSCFGFMTKFSNNLNGFLHPLLSIRPTPTTFSNSSTLRHSKLMTFQLANYNLSICHQNNPSIPFFSLRPVVFRLGKRSLVSLPKSLIIQYSFTNPIASNNRWLKRHALLQSLITPTCRNFIRKFVDFIEFLSDFTPNDFEQTTLFDEWIWCAIVLLMKLSICHIVN